MSDPGAAFTDKELAKLEKEILSIYKQASKDIKQKLDDFNAKYAVKEQIHLQELADGKITQEQFDSWKKGQVFQGKQWQAKLDQIQEVIANSNSVATNILNGHMTNVFTSNANFMSYQMEHTAGVNFGFGIYDSATVSNLLKNNPQLLPKWKIKEKKDYIWNKKNVRTAITQGIIQGERLDQIADRLAQGLSAKNKNKMLTFARTAMTGAQNAGRIYSIDAAKKLGINVKKQWMCTLDHHTRINHRLLDGQLRDNDKPFEINGYKIMYPGDPTAAPEMVYNCRCTLVSDVVDYPSTYDRYDNIDGKPIKNMTYSEWEEAKKKGEDISPVPLTWKKFDLLGLFKNKKMSAVYNDMKAVDSKTANNFYKELQGMGKPSEVWNSYLDGTLDNDSTKKIESLLNDYINKSNLLKTSVPSSSISVDDIIKNAAGKVKSASTLEDAQKALQEIQDDIHKLGADKVFHGIWKDDVTYADYKKIKDSIQKKRDYYETQIQKYKNLDPVAYSSQIKQFEDYLKQLDELEQNGESYFKLHESLEKAKAKIKSLTPITTSGKQFADDAFSDAVKKAAHTFSSRNAADKFHRKYLDDIWDTLEQDEKYGIWEYTRNSNPMNKPLSGYHDSWSRSDFIGLDKTDWGHEDSWRSIPSGFKKFGKNGHVTYHDAIAATTRAIDKSSLPEGVTLVRGSDANGFAGMIEGNLFSFDQASKLLNSGDLSKIKSALEGQIIQNHAFTSTGIATGTGFGGEISYKIYAPRGTHGIYAEPQSYYGDTVGMNARLYTTGQSYRSVGGEAEVILQRGTEFRITDIYENGHGYTVEMEIVAQPDYFKYGDEDTYNSGATRHKK